MEGGGGHTNKLWLMWFAGIMAQWLFKGKEFLSAKVFLGGKTYLGSAIKQFIIIITVTVIMRELDDTALPKCCNCWL